jgi:hypothetical protein
LDPAWMVREDPEPGAVLGVDPTFELLAVPVAEAAHDTGLCVETRAVLLNRR